MPNNKSIKWEVLKYSKNEINHAGKVISNKNSNNLEKTKALLIVDNWRSTHAYPLNIIYMNLRRNTNINAIVAQRLKKLDSIIKKLQRFPNMNLWRMQDLGGCRVILKSSEDVYNMAHKYDNSYKRHKLKRKNDYIQHPKESGYRSLHYIYEYKSDDKNSAYNRNILIEIQYRTKLQHLWATAVETMGIFTKQALKSGDGNKDLKRFFSLISSLFAIEEKQPIVPNTSDNIDELVNEIRTLNDRYKFLGNLNAMKVVSNYSDQHNNFDKSGFFILILNYATHRLKIKYYTPSQSEEANYIYNEIEKTRAESKIDTVLVRVESLEDLKNAYPNYFYDISSFIDKVKSYLH